MAAVGQVLVFRSPVDGGFSSLIFPTKRNWWRTSCPVLLDVHHCSSCPVGISLELLAPPTLMISGGTDLLSRIHKLSENVQRDGWSGCKERYRKKPRPAGLFVGLPSLQHNRTSTVTSLCRHHDPVTQNFLWAVSWRNYFLSTNSLCSEGSLQLLTDGRVAN